MAIPTDAPTVVWGDPPPDRSTRWERNLQEFVENPNNWGQVPEGRFDTSGGASALKHRLETGKVRIPEGDGKFEFLTRKVEDEDGNIAYKIWARYVVEADDDDDAE